MLSWQTKKKEKKNTVAKQAIFEPPFLIAVLANLLFKNHVKKSNLFMS